MINSLCHWWLSPLGNQHNCCVILALSTPTGPALLLLLLLLRSHDQSLHQLHTH